MASSRSWKGSDYAEPPHGQSPEIKPPVEVMRHNPGYGIMREFMGQCCIKMVIAIEKSCWRHRNAISRRFIIGRAALLSNISIYFREECVESCFTACGFSILDIGPRIIAFGQSITLVCIENGIGL
jgi:hypothetical protein